MPGNGESRLVQAAPPNPLRALQTPTYASVFSTCFEKMYLYKDSR